MQALKIVVGFLVGICLFILLISGFDQGVRRRSINRANNRIEKNRKDIVAFKREKQKTNNELKKLTTLQVYFDSAKIQSAISFIGSTITKENEGLINIQIQLDEAEKSIDKTKNEIEVNEEGISFEKKFRIVVCYIGGLFILLFVVSRIYYSFKMYFTKRKV